MSIKTFQIFFSGSKCKERLDLAFLLDGSGTMKQVYPYAKAFIMMLAEEFHLSPNHTHIGIIVFSEKAILEIPFNKHQDHDAFQKDVDNLDFVGYRTHLDNAFTMANEHLFEEKYGSRKGARKVLIALTDGRHNSADNSNDEMERARKASVPLLKKNVTIVVIGLFGSLKADQETLSHIAGNKIENVFMVAHSPDLLSKTFLDGMIYKYCEQTSIRLTPVGMKSMNVP